MNLIFGIRIGLNELCCFMKRVLENRAERQNAFYLRQSDSVRFQDMTVRIERTDNKDHVIFQYNIVYCGDESL